MGLAGALAAVVVFVLALLWAKWLPYGAKIDDLSGTRTWSGSDILSVGGVRPGDPPSWSAATSFTWAYGIAVWKALTAALLISAGVRTLVPRGWLVRVTNGRGRWSSAALGGLLSTPTMMCTCCTAPMAVTLRRSGMSTAATVAYWLGNPLLNPAVLTFLLLVAPWQWTVTRLVVGLFLVVGGAALASWLADRGAGATKAPAHGMSDATPNVTPLDGKWLAAAPGRYLRALLRLTVTLIPEYLVMVMLIGALRGWFLPFATGRAGSGALVVLIAAVAGTLLVIPTAGEIPILQGLAIAGLSQGAIGALLITLPAASLPGIAMVARTFGWRATAATTAIVILGGVLAAGLLAPL